MHVTVSAKRSSGSSSSNSSNVPGDNRLHATQVTFLCQVCNELARGYHFGAFTCEGCKSFFGRTCKPSKGAIVGNDGNRMPITKVKLHCKNGGKCNVQGRNRTSCKYCRFNKCIEVGMAPQNSRYGRRSKYFKVSSLIEAYERARSHADHQSPVPVVSTPLQLIKPEPAAIWAFPIWLSDVNVVSIRDVMPNGTYVAQRDPNELRNLLPYYPQTEPLDLSIKK